MEINQIVTLELNNNEKIEFLEVHQGDTARNIIVNLVENGQPFSLTGLTAQFDATIQNVVVAENSEAVVNDNSVTIPLNGILQLSGILKIDLRLLQEEKVVTAETLTLKVGRKVINEDSEFTPVNSTIGDVILEVDTAKGDFGNLNARFLNLEENCEFTENKTSQIDDQNPSLVKYPNEKAVVDYVKTISPEVDDTKFEKIANRVSEMGGRPSDDKYPSEKAVFDFVEGNFLNNEYVVSEVPENIDLLDDGDVFTAKATNQVAGGMAFTALENAKKIIKDNKFKVYSEEEFFEKLQQDYFDKEAGQVFAVKSQIADDVYDFKIYLTLVDNNGIIVPIEQHVYTEADQVYYQPPVNSNSGLAGIENTKQFLDWSVLKFEEIESKIGYINTELEALL